VGNVGFARQTPSGLKGGTGMKKVILIGMIVSMFIAVPAFAESAADQDYGMIVDVLAVRLRA